MYVCSLFLKYFTTREYEISYYDDIIFFRVDFTTISLYINIFYKYIMYFMVVQIHKNLGEALILRSIE